MQQRSVCPRSEAPPSPCLVEENTHEDSISRPLWQRLQQQCEKRAFVATSSAVATTASSVRAAVHGTSSPASEWRRCKSSLFTRGVYLCCWAECAGRFALQ